MSVLLKKNVLRSLIVLCTLSSALMLQACHWSTKPEQVKPIQQNLLTKCPPLSEHEGTTGAMVLNTLIRWAGEYNECAARHGALVDAVTEPKK